MRIFQTRIVRLGMMVSEHHARSNGESVARSNEFVRRSERLKRKAHFQKTPAVVPVSNEFDNELGEYDSMSEQRAKRQKASKRCADTNGKAIDSSDDFVRSSELLKRRAYFQKTLTLVPVSNEFDEELSEYDSMSKQIKRHKVCAEYDKTELESNYSPKHSTKKCSVANDESTSNAQPDNVTLVAENEKNHNNEREVDARTVAKPDFVVGDIVWAKIRGHPFWPAKIENMYGVKNHMCEILWFNDHRRTKVHKATLKFFLPNFDTHKKEFANHIGLETAAKEAVIYATSTKF